MGKLPNTWLILGMFEVTLELGVLLMIYLVNEISLRNHDLYLKRKSIKEFLKIFYEFFSKKR